MKELFDFIAGATVISNDSDKIRLEGQVAVLTFEKDNVKKTIAFCGNDCGSWIKEVFLTNKEFSSFEDWANTIKEIYYSSIGRFITPKIFEDDGRSYIFIGDLPEQFSSIDEKYLINAVTSFILDGNIDYYLNKEMDKNENLLNEVDKINEEIDSIYRDCKNNLKDFFGAVSVIDNPEEDLGSFLVTLKQHDQDINIMSPEGFTVSRVYTKENIFVHNNKIFELNEKMKNLVYSNT